MYVVLYSLNPCVGVHVQSLAARMTPLLLICSPAPHNIASYNEKKIEASGQTDLGACSGEGPGEGQAMQSSNVHMQFTQLDGKLSCSVMTLIINLLHNGNRLPLYSSLFILHAGHIDH